MWLACWMLACDGTPPDDSSTSDSGTSDSGTSDTGPVGLPWDWCPDADTFVGDEGWTAGLRVTDEALYCASPREGQAFADAFAAKVQLRVVAGTYAWPAEEGTWDLGLPACVRVPQDEPVASEGLGELSATAFDWGEGGLTTAGTQPLTGGRVLGVRSRATGDPLPEIVADDRGQVDPDNSVAFTVDSAGLGPCDAPGWSQEQHTYTFEGGTLSLLVQVMREGGGITAGTEPSAFPRAEGSLDDTAFDLTDPFLLAYVPDHHHFGRNWLVLFEAPIGEACGLRADLPDEWSAEGAEVHTVDCGLVDLEERAVSAVDYTRE